MTIEQQTLVISYSTPLNCGLATVPVARRTDLDQPEQYVLPGCVLTSCRNEARRAAAAIDDLIKANGGEKALQRLKQRTAA